MKTVTLAQIADAIEKNGLPQSKRSYFKSLDGLGFNQPSRFRGPITGACAVGQAAINLGVVPDFFASNRNDPRVIDEIILLNDNEGKSFKEIADYLRANHDLTISFEADEYDYTGVIAQ